MSRSFWLAAAPIALIFVGALAAAGAAEPPSQDNDARYDAVTPSSTTSIEVGSGKIIRLRGAATNVFAADPKVAEVRPASPTSLFVFGIAPGRTTVAAIDGNGNSVGQFRISVEQSSYDAAKANGALSREMPDQSVTVAPSPRGAIITGHVNTPEQAQQAVAVAKQYLDDKAVVEDRLSVGQSIQVSLRVRIAEMSRSLTRQLGIDWSTLASLGSHAAIGFATNDLLASAIPSSTLATSYAFNTPGKVLDLNNVIDALNDDQLVHLLAEPNLTTMSGEPASFLVGGEFPIPISSTLGETTVQFQQYGVTLSFVPTVLSDGRIRMHVRPEVSELTTAGAVTVQSGTNSSITIPALTVRRADTTIELGSGQSFAIAGLLQDDTQLEARGPPFLSEIPIIGALFRSQSFLRNQTELVIVVTPYVVKPVSDPNALHLSTDGWQPPNDLERLLLLRQSARSSVSPTSAHISGDAGFIVE